MSIEDIKTPEYRKKQKYGNLSTSKQFLKESEDLLNDSKKSMAMLEEMREEEIRITFNCPGFRGGGFSADPLYDKGEFLNRYYQPYIDYRGRNVVKFEVLNRKRLAVHTMVITWTNKPYRDIETANSLKIYTFKKGKGQDGLNFYIKENVYKSKKVYAGSILYNDKKLSDSVKYAMRELYIYGLTVRSIASIMKYLTKYKGEHNLEYIINVNNKWEVKKWLV